MNAFEAYYQEIGQWHFSRTNCPFYWESSYMTHTRQKMLKQGEFTLAYSTVSISKVLVFLGREVVAEHRVLCNQSQEADGKIYVCIKHIFTFFLYIL